MEQAIRVLEHLKGPVVPVNTCFGDDDSLDIGAMRKYVNWLCEQNVPAILRLQRRLSLDFSFLKLDAPTDG